MDFQDLDDDTMRRLTDGELFGYDKPDTARCRSCPGRFVELGYLLDLFTELHDSARSEAKQDVYTGLKSLVKEWKKHGRH